MGSSRFPGKPMALIHGVPMIGHCMLRASLCESLDEVYVATCDREIAEYITSIGGKAIMTSDTHERASDRAAEAMLKIEEDSGRLVDILIMIQGDEPMDHPEMINDALEPMLSDNAIGIVNLMTDVRSEEEFTDRNTVKVVTDKFSDAVYFSREPIPSRSKWNGNLPMMKQVCIIPFRRQVLIEFNSLDETPLERIESIDMLRLIENDKKVRMVYTKFDSIGVDTQEHLERVAKLMESDDLMEDYLAKGKVT